MKYKVLAPIGGTRRFPHMMGEVVTENDLVLKAEDLVSQGFIEEISDEEADEINEAAKKAAEEAGVPFQAVNPSAVPDDQFSVNVEKLSTEEKQKKHQFEADLSEAEKLEMQKLKDDQLAAQKAEEDAAALAEANAKAEAEKLEMQNTGGVSTKEIISALKKAGVSFDKNSSREELYEKYKML